MAKLPIQPVTKKRLADFSEKMQKATAGLKKIVFIDMDNVLVNFQSGIDRLDEQTKQDYGEHYESTTGIRHKAHYDDVPGIFALMDPMPGAIEAVQKLREHYDLYILSTAPWNNPTAWSDKLNWVKKHFGGKEDDVFYKRLILSHHKNLCLGDYLIDDRPHKCGADKFTGEVIHFGSSKFPNWDAVVEYLMAKYMERYRDTVKECLKGKLKTKQ